MLLIWCQARLARCKKENSWPSPSPLYPRAYSSHSPPQPWRQRLLLPLPPSYSLTHGKSLRQTSESQGHLSCGQLQSYAEGRRYGPQGHPCQIQRYHGGCWGPSSPQAIKAAWLGKCPRIITKRGREQRQVIMPEKYGRLQK